MKKIPYGMSDFKEIKRDNYYYIDKTEFIERIEDNSNFLFFLRPRRFGKSLLISTLESYYDKNYADEFDEIFENTYIIENPTRLKSSFHIMRFDFSAVDVTDYLNSFRVHLLNVINKFLIKYNLNIEFISKNPLDRLGQLFMFCTYERIRIYILIDEYDNFVNKLLVDDIGEYKNLVTTKEAFYKQFFTMLKVGTSGTDAPIKKMFFTGVSPLALFDVTSSSNIGANISMDENFNDVVGVTKDEVENLLNYYGFDDIKEKIISKFDEWYDGYRFSEYIEYSIYNTDMILYYLKSLIYKNREPRNLIDINVRTDYSKLKYLVYTDKKLNGNFNLLNKLIQNEKVVISEIKDDFSAFEMLEIDNFSSFLFALGFVTIEKYRAAIKIKIPNQTIKKIVADFIYSAFRDIDFNLPLRNFNNYLLDFAYDKNLQVFHYLNEIEKEQSVIRDYIDGEGFIKGFLTAYLSLNPYYEVKTEFEVTKGFVDILLNPSKDEIIYGAVIEIKYIPKSKFDDELLKEKILEATEQLNRYDVTKVKNLQKKEFVKIILVYKSWELIHCEAIN